MTSAASQPVGPPMSFEAPVDNLWRRMRYSGRIMVGGGIMMFMLVLCVATLPWTLPKFQGLPRQLAWIQPDDSRIAYDKQRLDLARHAPTGQELWLWFGTDILGRSMLGRCLLGGAISLMIGVAAAAISVVLGVTVGLVAGYRGGWVDSLLMRFVDILYGLPYVLLVILFKLAFEQPLAGMFDSRPIANLCVLFLAIGLVSWLTMARVVRGQVLSLRSQPFIEACRAQGMGEWRIFTRHLLPNLVGPITVYSTLIVPQAILQESFLSFLGIGIQPPVPTWGELASNGLLPALNTIHSYWWMLVIPCTLLAITLLSLNFLGDGLRDVFDPKREAAKI